jgi:Uncharacterized conserved protein, contains double-stranded beta-helix domain
MKINFNELKEKVVPEFLGGEKCFAVKTFLDDKNKIMLARLIPGASIGMHTHTVNCEILYVLSGKGKMLTEDGAEILVAGDCHYCPKGSAHSFVNDGSEDLVFFAVVPVQ